MWTLQFDTWQLCWFYHMNYHFVSLHKFLTLYHFWQKLLDGHLTQKPLISTEITFSGLWCLVPLHRDVEPWRVQSNLVRTRPEYITLSRKYIYRSIAYPPFGCVYWSIFYMIFTEGTKGSLPATNRITNSHRKIINVASRLYDLNGIPKQWEFKFYHFRITEGKLFKTDAALW